MMKLVLLVGLAVSCIECRLRGKVPYDIRMRSHRIVGGVDAPDTGVAYQASLRDAFWDDHFCGGSIISNRWILTAAHCIADDYALFVSVVVGTNRLSEGGNRYNAEELIHHENYDPYLINNDVGLVKTASVIEFNERVQPVPLASTNTDGGAQLQLSGWGRHDNWSWDLPDHLQVIALISLSVDECKQKIGALNPVYDSQICTLTREGEGACHGDSGGPLVEGGHVVGIVSWGMPCARGYPDVFTRVHSFRNWIEDNINQEESASSSSESSQESESKEPEVCRKAWQKAVEKNKAMKRMKNKFKH